jgi:hypothetical protein
MEARHARMQKRMRVAFAVGWAEALDLGEAEALKARDVVARFDERRAGIRKQLLEQAQVVRKAAEGDAAAQKALDGALAKLREARGQMLALHDEMFQALTQGFAPERKAKAALFLNRFRARAAMGMGKMRERMMQMRGPGGRGMGPGPGGMGPGPGGMGPGGRGMGPGMGPGGMGGTGMMVEPGGEGSPVFGAAPGGWMIDEVPDVDLSPDDEPL